MYSLGIVIYNANIHYSDQNLFREKGFIKYVFNLLWNFFFTIDWRHISYMYVIFQLWLSELSSNRLSNIETNYSFNEWIRFGSFFQPFCRWCPENFAESWSYQTRQMIFYQNVSVMRKVIGFLSFGQIRPWTSTW